MTQYQRAIELIDGLPSRLQFRFSSIRLVRLDRDTWMLNGMRCRREGCAVLLATEHRDSLESLFEMDSWFASQLTF